MLKLIAEYEGFAPYLYDDPVGHATVGFGYLVHLGNYHRPRGVCAACDRWARQSERHLWLTPAQGLDLLKSKVVPYADAVERTTRPLNPNEAAALVSLCYNIGPGGYLNSAVRAAVNKNQDPCPALRQIIRGTDGVIYPGLVRRREAECKLFHTPYTAPVPVEEDMKPFLAATNMGGVYAIYLIGPFGAAWITNAEDVKAFERLYGPLAVNLSESAIKSIREAA